MPGRKVCLDFNANSVQYERVTDLLPKERKRYVSKEDAGDDRDEIGMIENNERGIESTDG
jgi:hypothetical protein